MKKINTYSAQYKIISEQPIQNQNQNHPNPQSFARSFTPKSQSFANSIPNKKKLSKDRQEFISNISASGFKQLFS